MEFGRSIKKISTFQIIIMGFFAVIVVGGLLLMLPIASQRGEWTSLEQAMFTSTSAVCVTGLVVQDTATYWTFFGQMVILVLIQIGGLGIITVSILIVTISGRKISLMQRSVLQESLAAHQVGGIVRLASFIFRVAFGVELLGALVMLPTFCSLFGRRGIWMAIFHSISAFCNAGFDLMGSTTGKFSSLVGFYDNLGIVLPICFLIIIGGIGFLTWQDISVHKHHLSRYRMQSKVVLGTTLILIVLPTIFFYFDDFAAYPFKERLCLSFFQAVTPRTAGFNTADFSLMSSRGIALIIILMLIGGSPGSTAGGMKVTTITVLWANVAAVIKNKKSPILFKRRIEESTIHNASTLLTMYLFLFLAVSLVISNIENLPMDLCMFEVASAIGTVGLTLGITPSLGPISHILLMLLMFFGRVGGLTLMFALLRRKTVDIALAPTEKINVG